MRGSRKATIRGRVALALLGIVAAGPAVAQVTLTPEAQMATPAQEYAVIGRETIPIPLLSIGGNRASVTQSGQSNGLTLDQQGRSVATTQQIGSSNTASAALRGDQNALSLFQSGTGNKSSVTTSGSNTVGVQQIGDNNRSDITLYGQGATVTSQQIGSGMSNAITQGGAGKAVSVVQSR